MVLFEYVLIQGNLCIQFLVCIKNVAVFKHNAFTISLRMVGKDSVCACFINGCLMATSVTHVVTKAMKPWLTCTEKAAHKLTRFEHRFKTLRGFIFSWRWCQMRVCSGMELKQSEMQYGEGPWAAPVHGNYYVCENQMKVWSTTICLCATQILHWLKTSLKWALAVQLLTKYS